MLVKGFHALLLSLLAGGALPAAAPPPRVVRIAAAADLKWALEEVKAAFEKERPGLGCALTFGSSGNFYTQLAQRAPFDLFLSADVDYPRRLVEAGLGVKDSLFVYGIGHLVLWVPAGSAVPLEKLGLQAAAHPTVRRLAMANPRHAPYGRAAEGALRSAGLYDAVKGRLILGENVSQAAQFVETGNADLGLIALSLALSPRMKGQGRFWKVPQDQHPVLEQGGVILAWAQDPEAARAFKAFLTGPSGVAILSACGLAAPGK